MRGRSHMAHLQRCPRRKVGEPPEELARHPLPAISFVRRSPCEHQSRLEARLRTTRLRDTRDRTRIRRLAVWVQILLCRPRLFSEEGPSARTSTIRPPRQLR
jgi:hypothetical protein